MQLKLTVREVDGVHVVDCNGRIVFGEESATLRDTVKGLILTERKLVLNLGGVTYIDSGGLGILVSLYTSARSAGCSVRLANLTQRITDILQVTKLLTVFDTYESEDVAVASFAKDAA